MGKALQGVYKYGNMETRWLTFLFHEISGSHGGEYEDGCRSVMDATSTSEKLTNFYQTTRRNNPEDSHLQVLFHIQKAPGSILSSETGYHDQGGRGDRVMIFVIQLLK
jgi:hypothetical protein